MIKRCLLTMILLIFLFSTICYSVNIRHDVDDNDYINFAEEHFFESGLVVVRPFEETPGTGVIIHPNYILTAGHVGSMDGPAQMPINYKGKEYIVDYVYLYPDFSLEQDYTTYMKYDIAMLRLEGRGIENVTPSVIWTQPISLGQKIVGVGQGKSSTGLEGDERIPSGTFRAYENTIDYIFDDENYNLFVTDFDSAENACNSLSDTLYCLDKEINGESSPDPLPLEGSLGAGDSGSGIWIEENGKFYLAGIASGRHYASYCAQSLYVNLTNKTLYDWIVSICPFVSPPEIPDSVYLDENLSMMIPNIQCDDELLNIELNLEFYSNASGLLIWKLNQANPSTIQPLSSISINTDYTISFSQFIYQNQTVKYPVILEPFFNKLDPFKLYWKLEMK